MRFIVAGALAEENWQLLRDREVAVRRLEMLLERERSVLLALKAVLGVEDKNAAQTSRPVSVDQLRGNGIVEAALMIAESEQNVLRMTHARNMLVEAGVVPPGRDGISKFFRAIQDSHRFEPINGKRGRYRLLPEYFWAGRTQTSSHVGDGVPTRVRRP